MSTTSYRNIPDAGSPSWKDPVPNTSSLPLSGNELGDARVTTDSSQIYIWDGSNWVLASGGGGGAVDSVNGQVGVVVLVPHDLGLGSSDNVTFGSITDNGLTPNTALIANSSKTIVSSITTDTELSFVHGVTSSIQTQLNAKQPTLTIGSLTDAGTDGIIITNGSNAVIGSGTQLAQHVADATHNGYLSSSDWSTFNNKLDKSEVIISLIQMQK